MRRLLFLCIVTLSCSIPVTGHEQPLFPTPYEGLVGSSGPVQQRMIGASRVGTSSPTPEDRLLVLIYVHHPLVDKALHGHVACSPEAVFPLPRWIPFTDTPIHDTLRLLLRGSLTDHEFAAGFSTGFPLPDLGIASLMLVDGTLTVTFSDPQYSTTGGACRVTLLWAQIEKTALQFPEVDHVLHDPPDLFQP